MNALIAREMERAEREERDRERAHEPGGLNPNTTRMSVNVKTA